MKKPSAEPVFDISEHIPPLTKEDIFGNSKAVNLDIGSCEGEFIIELAEMNPDSNYIGTEIKLGRLKKAAKAIRKRNIPNIKLIHIDSLIAAGLFAPGTFRGVYINFPDPWPKDRHQKHRIINTRFVSLLGRIMVATGRLEIVSDHRQYIESATGIIEVSGDFSEVTDKRENSRPSERPLTKFENIFRSGKQHIIYLTYERKP